MSLADMIKQNLIALETQRTAQAIYDREAFAREKRGYARQARSILTLIAANRYRVTVADASMLSDMEDARQALRKLIADLERAE